jgi:hypothetical protein
MIILYGYKYIKELNQRTDELALVRFQTDIQKAVRTIAPDYGSVKRLEVDVPSKFNKVCFVDKSKSIPDIGGSCLCNPDINCYPCQDMDETKGICRDYNPLICDSWRETQLKENIFLVPMADIPIKAPGLNVSDSSGSGYICEKVVGGKIVVRLEGRGNSVILSRWS